MRLGEVPATVVVASGKGGVGKTYVAVELAKTLDEMGGTVGILDVDLTTPDADRAAGLNLDLAGSGGTGQAPGRVGSPSGPAGSPIEVEGIQVVTKGTQLPEYAVNTNDERMQRESFMSFVRETDWREGTTHVVVDTPPGTGWEIQAVLRDVAPDYGFIVTTGSEHSVRNACRTHELFGRVGVTHAVIANMRTIRLGPDRDRIAEHLCEVDSIPKDAVPEVVDAVADAVNDSIGSLHADGIILSERFSVPVVADVPFTDDRAVVREELGTAIEAADLEPPSCK